MKRKPMPHCEARATVAKALAHQSRLIMLEALAGKDTCVGELTQLVQADQSTVSRHLAVVKPGGIVDVRKEGVKTFYRMRIKRLEGFWGCVETSSSRTSTIKRFPLVFEVRSFFLAQAWRNGH